MPRTDPFIRQARHSGAMRERGILFSAPMVRALLNGTKTQTRRAIKGLTAGALDPGLSPALGSGPDSIACPYGQPGDRLWVRETFFAYGRWETRHDEKKGRDEWRFVDMTLACGQHYQYAADPARMTLASGRGDGTPAWHRRPALFMPRLASRILLALTSVRVERLQDISEADAIAEGEQPLPGAPGGASAAPVEGYKAVWETINGAGSWDANPWVWVIEFERIPLPESP